MISVNPHFSEDGLKHLYENYFIDRQTEETLRAQREIVYTIDRDWLLNFIDGGSILDVGCSGGFFLSHLMMRNGPNMVWSSLRIQLSTRGINTVLTRSAILGPGF